MGTPAFMGDKTNSVRIEGDAEMMAALQSLPGTLSGKYIRQAIVAGMRPVESQLIANTPLGPTGNLKRSVGKVVRTYRSGTIFGVVGYKRFVSAETSDSKGFHSHFLEFGTKERQPKKGPFLSSYGIRDWRPPSWDGRWPMVARRVRGSRAFHPLGMAFAATSGQAISIMVREMAAGLEKGLAEARARGLS